MVKESKIKGLSKQKTKIKEKTTETETIKRNVKNVVKESRSRTHKSKRNSTTTTTSHKAWGGVLKLPIVLNYKVDGASHSVVLINEGRKFIFRTYPQLEEFDDGNSDFVLNCSSLSYPKDIRYIQLKGQKKVPDAIRGVGWTSTAIGLLCILTEKNEFIIYCISQLNNKIGSGKILIGDPITVDLMKEEQIIAFRSCHICDDMSRIGVISYSKNDKLLRSIIDVSGDEVKVETETLLTLPKLNSFDTTPDLSLVALCCSNRYPSVLDVEKVSLIQLPFFDTTLTLPVFSKKLNVTTNTYDLALSSSICGDVYVFTVPKDCYNSRENLKVPTILNWHAHPIQAKTFQNDCDGILTAGEEGVAVYWNKVIGTETYNRSTYPRGGGIITDISFGCNQQWILLRRADNTVLTFDTQSNRSYRYAGTPISQTYLKSLLFGYINSSDRFPTRNGWSFNYIGRRRSMNLRGIILSSSIKKADSSFPKSALKVPLLVGPFEYSRYSTEMKSGGDIRNDVPSTQNLTIRNANTGHIILHEALQRLPLSMIAKTYYGGNYEEARPFILHDVLFFKEYPWVLCWLKRKKFHGIDEPCNSDRFRLLRIQKSFQSDIEYTEGGGSHQYPLTVVPIDDFNSPHLSDVIYFDSAIRHDEDGKLSTIIISGDEGGLIKIWTSIYVEKLVGPAGSDTTLFVESVQRLGIEERILSMNYHSNGNLFVALTSTKIIVFDTTKSIWTKLITVQRDANEDDTTPTVGKALSKIYGVVPSVFILGGGVCSNYYVVWTSSTFIKIAKLIIDDERSNREESIDEEQSNSIRKVVLSDEGYHLIDVKGLQGGIIQHLSSTTDCLAVTVMRRDLTQSLLVIEMSNGDLTFNESAIKSDQIPTNTRKVDDNQDINLLSTAIVNDCSSSVQERMIYGLNGRCEVQSLLNG